MALASVLSDAAAAHDLLDFDRYLAPILRVLSDGAAETPFTIGVFGAWGSGKSTLLGMVDRTLKDQYPQDFVRVHFNPWVHRREPNMLVPLLHTLHDTLERDRGKRFAESAKKIGNVLLRMGASILLKTITTDAVSLEKLETIEQAYCKQRGLVESEIRNLRSTLQTEMDDIAKKGARVVFFIDDLDRCEPVDLIDVLEAVKLFFDLRNVFILLAIDKEIVDRAVQIRYSKFAFADAERAAAIGAEYLEKLVQLPLTLLPLSAHQVTNYVTSLTRTMQAPKTVLAQANVLIGLLQANPRKIKRVLNILATTLAVLQEEVSQSTPARTPDALDPAIVMRLVVLQVQYGELYAEVVKQPEILLALELAHAGELRVEELGDFAGFGQQRESIQKATRRHYRPESAKMAALFAGRPYSAVRSKLSSYVSLLTG